MTYSFEGKVAIVTGAGGGLGRCHALELAKRGAKVIVNDLGGAMDGTGGSSTAADGVVAEIEAAGGTALANGGSVSDPAGAKSMVTDAMDAWGRVDVLINNAGILRDKSFAKMDMKDFEMVLDVHLRGSVYVTREVWEIMRTQGYGRIVMTTSPSGLYGNFGQTNYGAAKLGLVGFMNTLKIEGAKYNIHTNAIAPVAATRMTEDLMPEEALDALGPEFDHPSGGVFCVLKTPPMGLFCKQQAVAFQWLAWLKIRALILVKTQRLKISLKIIRILLTWKGLNHVQCCSSESLPENRVGLTNSSAALRWTAKPASVSVSKSELITAPSGTRASNRPFTFSIFSMGMYLWVVVQRPSSES